MDNHCSYQVDKWVEDSKIESKKANWAFGVVICRLMEGMIHSRKNWNDY